MKWAGTMFDRRIGTENGVLADSRIKITIR